MHPGQAPTGAALARALDKLQASWVDMSEADKAELFVPTLPGRLDGPGGAAPKKLPPGDLVMPEVALALGPCSGLWVVDLGPEGSHSTGGTLPAAYLTSVLKQLGVKEAPPLATLLHLCAGAREGATRVARLTFLARHLGHNKAYSAGDVAASDVAFIPGVPPVGHPAPSSPPRGGAGGPGGSRKRARSPVAEPEYIMDEDGCMVRAL